MPRLSILLVVLGAGCKGPPDAPEELDELMGYLFENVGNDDTAPLEVGSENLAAWLDDRMGETLEGYTVNNLTQAGVDSLQDGERSVEDVVGAAVGHESAFSVQDLGLTDTFIFPTVIYPETYEAYERDYRTDDECFRAMECDWLEYDTHATQNFPLGLKVTTNSRVQLRWLETDVGTVLVQRSWLHTPAEVNLDFLKLHEQYYMWVLVPTEEGAQSVQATWVVAEIVGAEVPENLALNLVVDSMKTDAETLDAFVAAEGPVTPG